MTPDDRKALATSILANPLFAVVMDEMEAAAIETLISAREDRTRMEAQMRVRAIRDFRSDLQQALGDTRPRKGAPA